MSVRVAAARPKPTAAVCDAMLVHVNNVPRDPALSMPCVTPARVPDAVGAILPWLSEERGRLERELTNSGGGGGGGGDPKAYAALQRQHDKKKEQLEDAKRDLIKRTQELKGLNTQNKKLRPALGKCKKDASALKARAAELEEEVNQQRQQSVEKDQKVASLQAKIYALTTAKQNVGGGLQDAASAKVDLQRAEDEIKRLRREMKSSQGKWRETENTLNAKVQAQMRLLREKDQAYEVISQSRMKQTNVTEAALKAEIETLKASVESLTTAAESSARAAAESGERYQALERRMQEEVSTAEARFNQSSAELNRRIQVLEEQLKGSTDVLNATLQQSANDAIAVGSLTSQLAVAKAAEKQSEERIEVLQTTLAELQADARARAASADSGSDDSLASGYASSTSGSTRPRRKKNVVSKDVAEIFQENNRLQERIASLQTALDAAKAEAEQAAVPSTVELTQNLKDAQDRLAKEQDEFERDKQQVETAFIFYEFLLNTVRAEAKEAREKITRAVQALTLRGQARADFQQVLEILKDEPSSSVTDVVEEEEDETQGPYLSDGTDRSDVSTQPELDQDGEPFDRATSAMLKALEQQRIDDEERIRKEFERRRRELEEAESEAVVRRVEERANDPGSAARLKELRQRSRARSKSPNPA